MRDCGISSGDYVFIQIPFKNDLSLHWQCFLYCLSYVNVAPQQIALITWMSQNFCNILVTWDTIQLLPMLWPSSWWWQTTLNCKMPSSANTLLVTRVRFASAGIRSSYASPAARLSDHSLCWLSHQVESKCLSSRWSVKEEQGENKMLN